MPDNLDPTEETMKRMLQSIMNDPIPEPIDERMEKTLQTFRRNLPEHPYLRSKNRIRFFAKMPTWFSGWNLAWSASLAIFLFLFIPSFLLGGGNPTWADVTQQFKSIPFFHATVYAKKITSKNAVQFEIWMGEGGKVRLRYGSQVVFADKKGFHKSYDILTRSAVKPDQDAMHVLQLINSAESFSLEAVIQILTGNMTELRALPTQVEGVSDDISIFELWRDNSPESIQIWALRGSLLPVQLQQKNRQSGESIDIFFSYLKQQPESFFDPTQFENILANSSKVPTELLEAY
ncbi:MAG: hypothetical protein JXR73_20350 [Candidatus Omnitrophica bacterium]|nr:hypothetical protein [Candidatus Omnitrophota bacterium]